MDALKNLDEIAKASDGLMVARGDLGRTVHSWMAMCDRNNAVCGPGAQVALEDVPSLQKSIVVRGRELGIPVIVASHLLESMLENPIPTRAEVTQHRRFTCTIPYTACHQRQQMSQMSSDNRQMR